MCTHGGLPSHMSESIFAWLWLSPSARSKEQKLSGHFCMHWCAMWGRLISSSCMLMSASETAERMQRLAREDCYRKHFNKHHNNCWLVCTSRLPNRFSALLFTFFSCTAFLCTPARYSETGFEGDNLSGKNLVKWKSGLLSPSTLLQQRLRMELFFTFSLLPACQVIFHL